MVCTIAVSRVGDVLEAVDGVDVTTTCEEELRQIITNTPPGFVQIVVLPRQTTHLHDPRSTSTCKGEGKVFPRAFGPELIPVYRQSARR